MHADAGKALTGRLLHGRARGKRKAAADVEDNVPRVRQARGRAAKRPAAEEAQPQRRSTRARR